jgi:hypothetical protein
MQTTNFKYLYAYTFLENMFNLNLQSRIYHWKETNRNKIMAFFLLQELHHQLDTKSCFSWRKILESPIFLGLFSKRRFLLLKVLCFADKESYDEAICGSKRLYKLKHILAHLHARFRSLMMM